MLMEIRPIVYWYFTLNNQAIFLFIFILELL